MDPIPLGGYVRITGMNPKERLPEEEQLDTLREKRGQLRGEGASDQGLETEIAQLEEQLASTQARAYYTQPVWKRVVVILAGPAMNLLIAFFLILWGIFWSQGIVRQRDARQTADLRGPETADGAGRQAT